MLKNDTIFLPDPAVAKKARNWQRDVRRREKVAAKRYLAATNLSRQTNKQTNKPANLSRRYPASVASAPGSPEGAQDVHSPALPQPPVEFHEKTKRGRGAAG